MVKLIETLVKYRNPLFSIHPSINNVALWSFAFSNLIALIRGLKWIFYGKNPKMALFGNSVKLFNSPKIKFGQLLKLGDYVYLSALGETGIHLGDNVSIGAFSRLVVSTSLIAPGKHIILGHHVGIGEYAYLGGAGGLEIGDECIIGQYFSCHPENHVFNHLEIPIRQQGVTRQGIKIGKNCWIGSKVSILDGVQIGDGCVIAAGSVVNRSFPANSVIGGVPAKLLKSRI